jgi:hypothetical protein
MFGHDQLIRNILNNSGLRETLREKMPVIDSLESLDGLMELQLTSIKTHRYLNLFYEATAMPDFYPDVKLKLAGAGIAESNLLDTGRRNEGKINEYEWVNIGNLDDAAQIFLKVYKPYN